MEKGTLFLIPVPLSEQSAHKSFTPFLKDTIHALKVFIVENEKTARKFLKEAEIPTAQSELQIHDYGKHKRGGSLAHFFKELLAGRDVGLMSEAGCPGVADPGADVILEAHKKGIRVVPLVGPSSILLALMASGFNGQSFSFHGYLPIDKADRVRRIKDLEQQSRQRKQTQIFIETPFRNNSLMDDLLKNGSVQTQLCVACNLTAEDELVKSMPIALWHKEDKPDLHKKPTIFLIYAG